jgi:diaminopimelate epimerase
VHAFPFTKYHGLGNDFIVLDLVTTPAAAGLASLDAARRLCDRHFGVGADGLLVLHPPDQSPDAQGAGAAAARRLVILNSDGSEPEMCGNGVRCVARYLHDLEPAGSRPETVAVQTAAGLRSCRVHRGPDGLADEITVDMGEVTLGPVDQPIPVPWTGERGGLSAAAWRCTRVSVGNPHAVFFVPAPSAALTLEVGPPLERHTAFAPRGANIELVSLATDGSLTVFVWERGAGATLACGTGACAVVAAACATGRAAWGQEVAVQLPGGRLTIQVDGATLRALMRGPAVEVFRGQLSVD